MLFHWPGERFCCSSGILPMVSKFGCFNIPASHINGTLPATFLSLEREAPLFPGFSAQNQILKIFVSQCNLITIWLSNSLV